MDQTTRLNRLRERYLNGGLERRRFLGLLGCTGLAAGFVGGPFAKLVRPAMADVVEIRFDGWGGVVSEALRKLPSTLMRRRPETASSTARSAAKRRF
jgi:spermidine/putrescine transport system substrate-binding protein